MIPFLDVKAINKKYEQEFAKAFTEFLDSGTCILGNKLQAFESNFASYCGTSYCLGVASGLDALRLLFKGYIHLGKLEFGDEVLVPANTYIASILAIQQVGLVPVLVEPNPKTFTLCEEDFSRKISLKTKAVLVVHLYGRLENIDAISELASKNNMLFIEDAAQAHGAVNSLGQKAGNLGHAAAFSFYPTKNLGALGDGGAITTNNAELAQILQKLRNYGSSQKYVHEVKGENSRLDELQAYFLDLKLARLDADNKMRIAIAQQYAEGIKNKVIQLPELLVNGTHVYYAYVIRCGERDRLQTYLKEAGVQTLIHYPIPPHKQQALKEFSELDLPVTERLHKEVLSIPISPIQTKETTQEIIKILNTFR